jgi:rhamnogalacturonan endolyase
MITKHRFACSLKSSLIKKVINGSEKMKSDVELIIDGLNAKLSNGIITVEFDENATVTSLIKNNTELAENLSGAAADPDKDHTFYVDYHAEGKFRNIKVSNLKVIKKTKDEAHIVYIDTTGLLQIEYNILMKKGESGLYSYVVAKSNTGKEFKLSELRTVYRLDSSIFDHAYNSERKGKQPVHSHLSQGEKIQDETYELPDGEEYTNGKIYSKYDYAGYYKDNPFWGQYGNGFGFWFIPVSTEYYPSGPLKQELLVHYNAIILNYMTGAHFGTGDFYVPPNWQKVYGPWYLYINCGNEEEVICDAAVQAAAEEKKWPYDWMNEPLYPTVRGCVIGKLMITHNRSSEGMMVVLAKPGGDFIRQKADYIFYSQADKKGNFKLSNVRPGSYSLYAYATQGDITGAFQKENIVVEKDDINLGEIIWDPLYRKNKLWQIGKANRTAAEFKFGNELRNYKWHCMVPKDLDYVIGKSQECEDWYYAQTKQGDWNIRFVMSDVAADKFYLTVAIASATKGKIDGAEDPGLIIKVNGHIVKVLSYPSDTTIYRSATQSGWYHLEEIELDSTMLHLGENIVAFTNNHSAIMYDTILLESD